MDAGVHAARAASHPIEKRRLIIEGMAGRLHALSPLATLARGYAVVSDEQGNTIASVEGVAAGQPLVARLDDGRVHAHVDRIERLTGDKAE